MTTESADTRDRVIRLEEQVRHLSSQFEGTNAKVTELHEFILEGKGQAKGFVWAMRLVWLGLYGAATVAGFKIAALLPWSGK